MRRLNVLLVVHDQERARHLIPEAVALPQHDRLCANATSFTNAHAATNLCSMSRGNIYTPRHAQNNGVWENTPLPFASDLRTDIPTVGQLFQQAGYATGYFGKWHMTAIDETQAVGREAMRKLFASYGFEDSDQKVMELALGEIPFEARHLWYRYQNCYWNCLRDVDRHLGTLLNGLAATGHADRTVVVLTADHGEMLGIHGLREKSGVPYREVSNVPLIVQHPDIEGARETPALASLVDVLPSLLGFAGLDVSRVRAPHPGLVGYDLSPALGRTADPGLGAAGRDAVLQQWTSLVHIAAEQARFFAKLLEAKTPEERAAAGAPPDLARYRGHMRGIFDGRFKFARYFSPRQHHRPEDFDTLTTHNDLELYDTLEDPGETNNLGAAPEAQRDRITDLNARLLALVDREVGVDDGAYLPGPAEGWRLGG